MENHLFKDLREQIAALQNQSKATHDAILVLTTRFNGGPGSWPPCLEHAKGIDDLRSEMREEFHSVRKSITWMDRRLYMAIGAAGLLGFLLPLIWNDLFPKHHANNSNTYGTTPTAAQPPVR